MNQEKRLLWEKVNAIRTDFINNINSLSNYHDINNIITASINNGHITLDALMLITYLAESGNSDVPKRFMYDVTEASMIGSITQIVWARKVLKEMSRDFVIENLEKYTDLVIAKYTEQEGEEWLYRRLIELCMELQFISLMNKTTAKCRSSGKEELIELANDFCQK